MDKQDRTELLRQIKDEVINFKKSPLYAERVKNKVFPVIGEGSHWAKIMFIGEAPGRNEAATGQPFCGAAGKVLDEMLESVGLLRSDVYVTNIVKDRPPLNRDPLPEEIEAYAPFLDRQIEIIQPQIIATLGRFSMKYIVEKLCPNQLLNMSISALRGHIIEGKTIYSQIKIIPLYHPAATLYNPALKEDLKKDFQVLKKEVESHT